MAALLKERLGVEAELVKGSGGIFVVAVDGVSVAAKTREGFPTDEVCVAAVGQALGRPTP